MGPEGRSPVGLQEVPADDADSEREDQQVESLDTDPLQEGSHLCSWKTSQIMDSIFQFKDSLLAKMVSGTELTDVERRAMEGKALGFMLRGIRFIHGNEQAKKEIGEQWPEIGEFIKSCSLPLHLIAHRQSVRTAGHVGTYGPGGLAEIRRPLPEADGAGEKEGGSFLLPCALTFCFVCF